MRLLITDKEDDRLDCHCISIDNFNDICYHPYLKNMKLESVVVDLDDRINRSYIKQILGVHNNVVPRLVGGDITPKQILLLVEMLPDDVAEVYGWMKLSKEDRVAAFNAMRDKKNWALEY